MRAVAAARAMLVIALLGGIAWAAGAGRETFERARRLIEANCGDCAGATRQELEDGVMALRRSLAEGYADPASVYRLLAEAYATLARVYAKPAEKPIQPAEAPAPPPVPERCDAYRGRALRGQALELPLSGGLVFRLAPDAYGWTMGVIAAGRPDEDFAGIATPPYHGINARYLEGWHFRNHANTGPNAGDVNAPQDERDFAFVLSANDYARASRTLEALLWGARPEAERQQPMETLERVSRGRGRLRVTGSSLGNLLPGAHAWFEWLSFDVELCRPAAPPG